MSGNPPSYKDELDPTLKLNQQVNKNANNIPGNLYQGTGQWALPEWPIADSPDTSDKKLSTTQKDSISTAALGGAESAALAPVEDQLSNLPSEYAGTVAGIMGGNPTATADAAFNAGAERSTGNASLDAAMAKGYTSPTGDAALNNSDNALTQSILSGANAVESKLAGLPEAEAKAAAYAPYSDVLTTLLTQKKDEILYGETAIPETVNTKGWSDALKDVYSYIQGNGANGLSSTSVDQLPGITTAAEQAANNTSGTTTAGSPANPGI